jgi:hypothetical protein
VRDPEQRASVQEALDHPWIQKYVRPMRRPGDNLARTGRLATMPESLMSRAAHSMPGNTGLKDEGAITAVAMVREQTYAMLMHVAIGG